MPDVNESIHIVRYPHALIRKQPSLLHTEKNICTFKLYPSTGTHICICEAIQIHMIILHSEWHNRFALMSLFHHSLSLHQHNNQEGAGEIESVLKPKSSNI